MSENKMRFTIGQEILVVDFIYDCLDMFGSSRPFAFGSNNCPKKTVIFKLKVTEHHQVPWDQDPTGQKKYDGFKLITDAGEVWYNQYPVASYGQVSDHCDRIFDIALAHSKATKDLPKEKIMSQLEQKGFFQAETLTGFIANFFATVKMAREGDYLPDPTRINRTHAIIKFFEDLCAQIFKEFGKGVVIKEYDNDGETVVTKGELVDADNDRVVVEKHHLDELFSQKHHPAKQLFCWTLEHFI